MASIAIANRNIFARFANETSLATIISLTKAETFAKRPQKKAETHHVSAF